MGDILDFTGQPVSPAPEMGQDIDIGKPEITEENTESQIIPSASDDEEGQKEVAKSVFAILDKVLQDKENLGLIQRWKTNYEMVRGKHWPNKDPERKIPLVTANFVHLHMQRTVNALTDNNPTFNVVHVNTEALTEDPENNVYEDLQKCTTHWWVDQEQQDILEASVRNGETYGIAIEKVIFNPDLEYGMGEIETVVVDPYHFGVFPVDLTNPRDIQKAQVVLHYYPMLLSEVQRRYPKANIKADSDIEKQINDERRDINSVTNATKERNVFASVASTVKRIFNYKGEDVSDEKVLMVEAWVHDYTVQKITTKVVQDGVKKKLEASSPKYPGYIRYILCCNGDKVLEDKPNPNINMNLQQEQTQKTYLYDKFPFAAANSIKDTVSLWGASDLEQIEWLNKELNKALSQYTLIKDRASRAKVINPKDSGVPNSAFTNFLGIIEPANTDKSKGIRYFDYPKSEQDILKAIELFEGLILKIAGTFEVDQAQMRGNDAIAYKAIAVLIERAATMQRGKIRSYGRLIRERGRMFLSHVMNFYQEDRWISYEDKDGIPKTKKINGSELIVPAKLTVVTGSTLPTSKVQQREESLSLYKERAIDRQALLENLEWSGRAEIIERMNQGPVGQVMDALKTVGVPKEFIEYFSKIAVMQPQKLEGMMQSRQVPPFEEVLKPVIEQKVAEAGQQMPQEQPDPEISSKIEVNRADAQRKLSEAGKFAAQQQLAIEQTNTEKIKQSVAAAGIGFDAEKLKIEKARTVAEVRQNVMTARREAMQSEIPSVTTTPARKPGATAREDETSAFMSYPAGYNERGMESNNVLD